MKNLSRLFSFVLFPLAFVQPALGYVVSYTTLEKKLADGSTHKVVLLGDCHEQSKYDDDQWKDIKTLIKKCLEENVPLHWIHEATKNEVKQLKEHVFRLSTLFDKYGEVMWRISAKITLLLEGDALTCKRNATTFSMADIRPEITSGLLHRIHTGGEQNLSVENYLGYLTTIEKTVKEKASALRKTKKITEELYERILKDVTGAIENARSAIKMVGMGHTKPLSKVFKEIMALPSFSDFIHQYQQTDCLLKYGGGLFTSPDLRLADIGFLEAIFEDTSKPTICYTGLAHSLVLATEYLPMLGYKIKKQLIAPEEAAQLRVSGYTIEDQFISRELFTPGKLLQLLKTDIPTTLIAEMAAAGDKGKEDSEWATPSAKKKAKGGKGKGGAKKKSKKKKGKGKKRKKR